MAIETLLLTPVLAQYSMFTPNVIVTHPQKSSWIKTPKVAMNPTTTISFVAVLHVGELETEPLGMLQAVHIATNH